MAWPSVSAMLRASPASRRLRVVWTKRGIAIPVITREMKSGNFWDVYFGSAGKLFDPVTGNITDPAYAGRLDKFLNELGWMARALRFARENLPVT